MRENVLKNTMHLVHLYGYQGETQLGEQVEMLSVHIARTEGPGSTWGGRRLFDFLREERRGGRSDIKCLDSGGSRRVATPALRRGI